MPRAKTKSYKKYWVELSEYSGWVHYNIYHGVMNPILVCYGYKSTKYISSLEEFKKELEDTVVKRLAAATGGKFLADSE